MQLSAIEDGAVRELGLAAGAVESHSARGIEKLDGARFKCAHPEVAPRVWDLDEGEEEMLLNLAPSE